MKKTLLFLVIFLAVLVFSANAADIIVLKDGSMIEAKIMEIYPTEIRYKRADNLNGAMIILPKSGILSIRHENGVVEIVNLVSSSSAAQPAPPAQTASPPPAGQGGGQTAGAGSNSGQQPGAQTLLQTTLQTTLLNTLNTLPAITIAGNSLKFQFNSDSWTALLNGENFLTGTVEVEETNDGSILNLKQTHMWPGAAGKKLGKLASKVPGGAVVGGALNVAGSLAGAVEMSGPVIVLEYKAGPPAKLAYLRSTGAVAGAGGSLDGPVNIVLADGQWTREAGTEHASTKNDTTVQFNVVDEEIGGQVREVLTLETSIAKGSGWRFVQIMLNNETMVQTLQKGSGVRFKVLGDGKKWILIVPTNEGMSDYGFYQIPIATKKEKVVEINVPYKKLKQPTWGKKVPFIKSSIIHLQFQRNSDIGGTGPSTIKIFDFVVY
jgi:hypothetical protein